MRGLDDGMPHRTEDVVPLIIGEQENDIGPLGGGGWLGCCERTDQTEEAEEDEWGEG